MADEIQAHEARLNITWNGQNGDLPDPVSFDAADGDLFMWAQEAVRNGDVPGIGGDQNADFHGFIVDRYPATNDVPYNRLMLRPKTAFGG